MGGVPLHGPPQAEPVYTMCPACEITTVQFGMGVSHGWDGTGKYSHGWRPGVCIADGRARVPDVVIPQNSEYGTLVSDVAVSACYKQVGGTGPKYLDTDDPLCQGLISRSDIGAFTTTPQFTQSTGATTRV
jgi:hypothetical protein